MNINSLPDKSVIAASAGAIKPVDRGAVPAQNQNAAATAATPERSPSVEVRLSAVTQTMTNNVARSGTDVFNADKVNAVRTAIQNGSFSVNAHAVADRLMANAREMMSVASAAPTTDNASAVK